jgi:hypothetical protein
LKNATNFFTVLQKNYHWPKDGKTPAEMGHKTAKLPSKRVIRRQNLRQSQNALKSKQHEKI